MVVFYVVMRKLVVKVCVCYDWWVMYLIIKGDDCEYFVDILVLDVEFEVVGGFDFLYIKMSVEGILIIIEFMWILLKEWFVWDFF